MVWSKAAMLPHLPYSAPTVRHCAKTLVTVA